MYNYCLGILSFDVILYARSSYFYNNMFVICDPSRKKVRVGWTTSFRENTS